jgi:hypothetical protein
MTPVQKRAYNRAKAALTRLAQTSASDHEAFEAALELLAHAAGAMIGGVAAMRSIDIDDVHATTDNVARHTRKIAARTYGETLARQKAAAGRPS